MEFYDKKNVLILGGAGFIGSVLADELLNLGAHVTIIDGFVKDTGANIENINPFLSRIRLFKTPIESLENLSQLVETNDVIIDCMGFTSHELGIKYPLVDSRANLISHIHLIEGLKSAQDKKVIFLGSRSQYGKADTDSITEQTPMSPLDVQGINKLAAESFYKVYSSRYGFNILSLRIVNCFGEHQKNHGADIGLVGSFIKDILSGKTVEIYGDANRKKSLIYVRDLVRIIAKATTTAFQGFEALNVAGAEVSLESLLRHIKEITGKGDYVILPFPEKVKLVDVGETRYSDLALRKKIGDIKFTQLKMSLQKTIEYFESRKVPTC
ncbi:MAG: NAD-dependent epimerase/dehydratase family protein [Nitrospinales bacterium]